MNGMQGYHIHIGQAAARLADGDAGAAIDGALQAARLDPEERAAYALLARGARAAGDAALREAARRLGSKGDGGGEPAFLETLAGSALRAGLAGRARAAVAVLAALVEPSAEGDARLARLLVAAGAVEEAAGHAARALALDEWCADAWLAAAEVAAAFGLDAAPALARAVRLGSLEAALSLAAALLVGEEACDERVRRAAALLLEGAARSPALREAASFDRALLALREGRIVEARARLEGLVLAADGELARRAASLLRRISEGEA